MKTSCLAPSLALSMCNSVSSNKRFFFRNTPFSQYSYLAPEPHCPLGCEGPVHFPSCCEQPIKRLSGLFSKNLIYNACKCSTPAPITSTKYKCPLLENVIQRKAGVSSMRLPLTDFEQPNQHFFNLQIFPQKVNEQPRHCRICGRWSMVYVERTPSTLDSLGRRFRHQAGPRLVDIW